MNKITFLMLLLGFFVYPNVSAYQMTTTASINFPEYIIGDWVAQIDIPQGEMTILMEMNILDKENCIIKCRWSGPYPTEEESGKAKYKLYGNKLIITFLKEEEVIRTDHIFEMENIYDISLSKDKLVILNNPLFQNVDVNFGKGYDNRGFCKVYFPDDE